MRASPWAPPPGRLPAVTPSSSLFSPPFSSKMFSPQTQGPRDEGSPAERVARRGGRSAVSPVRAGTLSFSAVATIAAPSTEPGPGSGWLKRSAIAELTNESPDEGGRHPTALCPCRVSAAGEGPQSGLV